jgi:hypothetical protein
MIDRACRAALVLLAVAGTCVLPACKVDKEAFHHRLYSCNPSAANPACGTDIDDKPMACVPAYQLGGRNFCATGCDAITQAPEADPTAVCLSSGPRTAGPVSGARLPRCNPTLPGSCNHDELTCLRTDLIVDEGVCMTVNACEKDTDCRDPVRSKCMGELVRETYGAKSELKAQNTYCLQAGCKATGTACSPGEVCMRNVIPRSSYPPDICVPNCDANGNCPPNYFCYTELYSKASPAVCLPGLIGLRCRSRLDCLFGDCVDTDAHFKVCSVACQSDADCQKFDSIQGTFFCNDKGYCAGARAFRGSICYKQEDCLYEGEICAKITHTNAYGQCLQQCPGGTCPSYGGVPHACRPQVGATDSMFAINDKPWICWPGYLGQLCSNDAQCLPGLTCRAASPTNQLLRLCSIACQSDADCDANRFTADGFCNPAIGICVSPLPDGATCERSAQCESKTCNNDKKCAPLAGF